MGLGKKQLKALEELSSSDRLEVRNFYEECFNNFRKYIADNEVSLDDCEYILTITDEETLEEKEQIWSGRDFWFFCMDLFRTIRELNEND